MSVREDIIAAIEEALIDVKDSNAYDTQLGAISRFDENVLNTDFKTPLIMISDEGDDEIRVQDSTHYRFRSTIKLNAFVKVASQGEVQSKLNAAVSTLRTIINAGITLPANVLEYRFLNNEAHLFSQDKLIGYCTMNTRLTWYALNGTF